jgi:hypothetical protein
MSLLKAIGIVVSLVALLSLSIVAYAGDKETALYNFQPNMGGVSASGYYPAGALLQDQSGNLYGVALNGGLDGTSTSGGTVYELSPNGSGGYTINVLASCAVTIACSYPSGSLVMDGSGNLYGATGFGNVFELSPDPGGWSASVIYTFAGQNGGYDGYGPGAVILDSAGNLYGMNYDGGINNQGYVFELSPSAGGYTLTHLHDFTGTDGDGAVPGAGLIVSLLIMDDKGNLYGMAAQGGNSTYCTGGCGNIFELSNNAGVWTEKILHEFIGKDGSNPIGQLMMDSSGNLYGTASTGGAYGSGSLFETSLVSGKWETHDIYSFRGGANDGAYPNMPLIMDTSGNLYGTTEAGGNSGCSVQGYPGCGTAFKLSPGKGGWKETVLHIFSGLADGAFPQGVIFPSDGTNGDLYGLAQSGGGAEGGLAFELAPPPGAPLDK